MSPADTDDVAVDVLQQIHSNLKPNETAMPHRLHVTLLKDDEPTIPDVLGRSCTLHLPNKLPNLTEFHRHTVWLFNHADLIIHLLEVTKKLFPCGANLPPKDLNEPAHHH